MSGYTEPNYCLRCSQPTSMCQCAVTVTDTDDFIRSLLAEVGSLERQDEVHMKTRRSLLRQIDAWKWKLRDTRRHLQAVVDGYFNDSGAEPSVSVLGRATDQARSYLCETKSDSAQRGHRP